MSGSLAVVTGLPAIVPHLAVLQALHMACILAAESLWLHAHTDAVGLGLYQQCRSQAVTFRVSVRVWQSRSLSAGSRGLQEQ